MKDRRDQSAADEPGAIAQTAIVVAMFLGAVLMGGLLAIAFLALMQWSGMLEPEAATEVFDASREGDGFAQWCRRLASGLPSA
jgi:hypothetical protein